MAAMQPRALASSCLVLALVVGCDDSEKPKNPFEPPPKETVAPPAVTEVPKPPGPPALAIDDLGPKVGFSRVLLDKPEGRQKLDEELSQVKSELSGKEVALSVIRKAKLAHVVTMLGALEKVSVAKVLIKTDTREEYPKELAFTPLGSAKSAAPCSVVTMVLSDRSTASWRLAGGLAMRRPKGFAGPDLTMTGETIERLAKGCKDSSTLFISAADEIEWGLAYDLAASTKKIEGVTFDAFVLLLETPIAGRKVKL